MGAARPVINRIIPLDVCVLVSLAFELEDDGHQHPGFDGLRALTRGGELPAPDGRGRGLIEARRTAGRLYAHARRQAFARHEHLQCNGALLSVAAGDRGITGRGMRRYAALKLGAVTGPACPDGRG